MAKTRMTFPDPEMEIYRKYAAMKGWTLSTFFATAAEQYMSRSKIGDLHSELLAARLKSRRSTAMPSS